MSKDKVQHLYTFVAIRPEVYLLAQMNDTDYGARQRVMSRPNSFTRLRMYAAIGCPTEILRFLL